MPIAPNTYQLQDRQYETHPQAATATPTVSAIVTMTFTPDHFDMAITLTNQTSAVLQYVLFPSDLLLANSSMQAAYLPSYLPGVKLNQAYFNNPKSFSFTYPGDGNFADFLALDLDGSHVAWYTVNPAGRIAPETTGLVNDSQSNPGRCYFTHTFAAWLTTGATFQSSVIRFRVGQSADSAVHLYRAESGISGYPLVSQKLGTSFATVARAPLVKLDLGLVACCGSVSPTFNALATRLTQVQSPALVHPVSYWPVNFDRDYPDFLPPNPNYGTTEDFGSFVRSAQSNGMLVMPYTNPTWWDPQSPTVRASTPAAFAALDQTGNAIMEIYGPNTGFRASYDSPATQKRLDDLMRQWVSDVPVDLVFNDQIGARAMGLRLQPRRTRPPALLRRVG